MLYKRSGVGSPYGPAGDNGYFPNSLNGGHNDHHIAMVVVMMALKMIYTVQMQKAHHPLSQRKCVGKTDKIGIFSTLNLAEYACYQQLIGKPTALSTTNFMHC